MTGKNTTFVFHDPTGRRWARFRRVSRTGAMLLVPVLVLVLLSLWISPQLPSLGLPAVPHLANFAEVRSIIKGERLRPNVPFKLQKAGREVKYVRSASPVLHLRKAGHAGASQPIVFGYYVNWDRASLVSLRMNISHLTHLVPEWFILQNTKGDIDDQSDPTVIKIAADANLPILGMFTNYRDSWQAGDLHRVLNSNEARANLIDNIESNLKEHKLAGVNIDFEELKPRDRDRMIVFLEELRARLKPQGYILSESVPVDDPAYDLKRIAGQMDYVVPMVYDEHYQSGPPGPVASQSWFDDQLEKLAKTLPPEKTIVGIGNYGYDWRIGGTGAAEVTFDDVLSGAAQNKAAVVWDPDTENPALRFTAADGSHEIWYLDAVTALNEMTSISDDGFRGVGLWRLGAEDPDLWKVLGPAEWPTLDFDPARLARLTAEKSVHQYGSGEILRIVQTPRDGTRQVWKGADDDFIEKYGQYPSYYVVENYGSPPPKTIALTFDDGPDSRFTPAVLDILKARHVPATFFVLGVNAEEFPGLVRRMYAEGHEIGNHTYSHPNIAAVSAERTRVELSATERIIENIIGVSTLLFRPPYNADSEPATPEEIIPLVRAQSLNFITVGESIDPRDWEKGITPAQIYNEVVDEQKSEENAHVVLLHDAGGDRTATIAALPRLIDHFHSEGFRFVLVSELIGKSRSDVMPVPSAHEMRWAHIEGGAADFKSNVKTTIGMLFLGAIYLTMLRSFAFGLMAVVQSWRARKLKFDPAFRPPVSVIIAAYNEEKVILRTVTSLLANDYEDLEVVVVDDGSKDRTLAVLREDLADDERVRIFTQPNTGKAGALNHAIAQAHHEILIAVDADTIFQRGTIGKLVRHFSDPAIGAVSGNARVGNPGKWITRFQSIEYIYGFNLDRRALDLLNAITVVPGAVGAWRKSLVTELGGFGNDTLAEDTDLTLAIRRQGYRIRYDDEAVAYTEAPEDISSLARQRFRWAFGTLQAAWKHRDVMFNPQYGSLGFVALPSIWVFQVLLSALSPLADVAMVVALFAGNWRIVLLYYLGFFVLELLTGLLAYRLEHERPWDLALLFFQRIFYRQLMYYVLAKSLLFAVQGRLVGWGKLERRASVQQVP